LGLRANNSGIDCQPFHVWVRCYRLKDTIKYPIFDPAIVALLDGLKGAEAILWNISPTSAGTGKPEERIKKRRPSLRGPRRPFCPYSLEKIPNKWAHLQRRSFLSNKNLGYFS
jgi:hypothetical protein